MSSSAVAASSSTTASPRRPRASSPRSPVRCPRAARSRRASRIRPAARRSSRAKPVTEDRRRFSFVTPPLTGIKADTDYKVVVRVLDADGTEVQTGRDQGPFGSRPVDPAQGAAHRRPGLRAESRLDGMSDPDPAEYRFRTHAFAKDRTFLLTDDALVWGEDGARVDGVFYDDIAEIRRRLSRRPGWRETATGRR